MDYSWPQTRISQVQLEVDKKKYVASEVIQTKVRFKVVGGLREAFHPDVWTVAWEDFDKVLRLTIRSSVRLRSGLRSRKLAENKKEVRRASFYWSRDPDLPYRIWTAIIHEDGSAPIIPVSVEDVKSKFLDVIKTFEIPASTLGKGSHRLVGAVDARWGRRSYIEKGRVSGRSTAVELKIE